MSPTLKRVLLIVLLLLVAGAIGYGLYYVLFRTTPPQEIVTTPPQPGAGGELPGAGVRPATTTGGLGQQPPGTLPSGNVLQPTGPTYYKQAPVVQLTNSYASYPSSDSNGAFRYYDAADGKFYKISAEGNIKAITDQVFYNASNVTWAKNKDEAVIEYPDGSKVVYNFDTKQQVTSLPKHWEEFSFSPDGTQIAAKSMGLSPESRWLVTTNDNGTGARIVEPMGENADRVTVNWSPSKQVAAFSQTGEPLGAERREVLFIGLNGENLKSTVVEGLGFEPQWSPTGKKLLYSVYSSRSDYKPELWIVNSYGDDIGSGRQLLNLNTWSDKCTFGDDSTLFCAVPKELPQGAAMARDIANDISDNLFKIDLKTGLKTPITLDGDYNIANISYDTTHNKIFFTDLNKVGVFESKL